MSLTETPCYLCGNLNLEIIRTKLRHNITRNVLRCKSCDLVFLQPKDNDLDYYYEEEYRKNYSPIIGQPLSSREIFNIYLPFQKKRIDEIKHILNAKMNVLEIGCSAGHFLHSVKPYVNECVGIEFNKSDANFVSEELGIKTYTTAIEDTDIPKKSFDIIFLYFVLEHIEDPIPFLNSIQKYLKDDGYLVIKVPNKNEALISVYNVGSYADFWYREPHIYYFSPESLKFLLQKANLNGVTVTVEEYNILNQLNWIFTGKPQTGPSSGMSDPILVESAVVDKYVKDDLNEWIKKVNQEYFNLINKHELGENILFIGKKEGIYNV